MPKITGPLFSLAASGTYRGEMTFRTNAKGTHAYRVPKAKKPRTTKQQQTTAKVAALAAAWSDLPESVRQSWRTRAVHFNKTGRALWWQCWFNQNCDATHLPILP